MESRLLTSRTSMTRSTYRFPAFLETGRFAYVADTRKPHHIRNELGGLVRVGLGTGDVPGIVPLRERRRSRRARLLRRTQAALAALDRHATEFPLPRVAGPPWTHS